MQPLPDPRVVEAFLVPPPPKPREAKGRPPPGVAAPYRPRLVIPFAPAEVTPIPAPAANGDAPGAGMRSAPAPLPRPWDGLREALRGSPAGCANRDRVGLTVAEREACNEKAGAAAALAKPLPLGIAPDKQAGFDAAAAGKARLRREREGSLADPMPPCRNNFGVACTPDH